MDRNLDPIEEQLVPYAEGVLGEPDLDEVAQALSRSPELNEDVRVLKSAILGLQEVFRSGYKPPLPEAPPPEDVVRAVFDPDALEPAKLRQLRLRIAESPELSREAALLRQMEAELAGEEAGPVPSSIPDTLRQEIARVYGATSRQFAPRSGWSRFRAGWSFGPLLASAAAVILLSVGLMFGGGLNPPTEPVARGGAPSATELTSPSAEPAGGSTPTAFGGAPAAKEQQKENRQQVALIDEPMESSELRAVSRRLTEEKIGFTVREGEIYVDKADELQARQVVRGKEPREIARAPMAELESTDPDNGVEEQEIEGASAAETTGDKAGHNPERPSAKDAGKLKGAYQGARDNTPVPAPKMDDSRSSAQPKPVASSPAARNLPALEKKVGLDETSRAKGESTPKDLVVGAEEQALVRRRQDADTKRAQAGGEVAEPKSADDGKESSAPPGAEGRGSIAQAAAAPPPPAPAERDPGPADSLAYRKPEVRDGEAGRAKSSEGLLSQTEQEAPAPQSVPAQAVPMRSATLNTAGSATAASVAGSGSVRGAPIRSELAGRLDPSIQAKAKHIAGEFVGGAVAVSLEEKDNGALVVYVRLSKPLAEESGAELKKRLRQKLALRDIDEIVIRQP